MSKFLDIDALTALCMTTCKGATAEDRHLFRVWTVMALRDIGPNRDWMKVEAIYPRDFSFEKPSDHVSTIDITLFDVNNNEIKYRYNSGSKRIRTDRFSVNNDVSTESSIIDLSEDANYFHLSTNAGDVSYMVIRYLGMPVDQEGFPLIPEDDAMAYEAYARFMWGKRQDENRSKIDQDFQFWTIERNKVKGRRKMPTPLEAKRIFEQYMSLVSAPIIPPNF
jgi:hypothetical protein